MSYGTTPVPIDDWKRDFVNHMVRRLVDAGWDEDKARDEALSEFGALEDVDTSEDPGGAADDCLTYLDDGEDEE